MFSFTIIEQERPSITVKDRGQNVWVGVEQKWQVYGTIPIHSNLCRGARAGATCSCLLRFFSGARHGRKVERGAQNLQDFEILSFDFENATDFF